MPTFSPDLIKRLFTAGAHFGFKKSRRHPTITPYLFTAKDGSDIFDLDKTSAQIATAVTILGEAAKNGKVIWFVSTKTEMARLVKTEAEKIGVPFVVNRWIGGMLTNWSEIKKRIFRLETLMAEKESGELERKYTKKERVLLNREVNKLQLNFGGIKASPKIADLLVIVDPRHDHIAVKEAREMNLPIIAIMSSDCDVSLVTYPIVMNDSLQASVTTVLRELTQAITAGQSAYVPKPTDPNATRNRRPRPDASR